jgi:glycosyltransferase involved in cell wall biosynthesis
MRILRVISSMNPTIGGPCQGIRNIIPMLVNQGIINDVVCLDNPDSSYLGKDSFTIFSLGPSYTSMCFSGQLVPWLERNIQNYDVVIVHGIWQYHSYSVKKVIDKLKSQKLKMIPKVYIMPHGMLDPWFQKAKERKWKAVRNYIYWEVIEKKVVNEADGLLFTCQTELELARGTFRHYKPKQELNIGYGIQEPPVFIQAMRKAFLEKCNMLNGKPYLLFLSRIHEKKGLDLLIDAYQTILEENDIPDLIVAGPGIDTVYGQKILNTVSSSPLLKNKVHFTGMLVGDAKWGAIYGCEAFVLPSHQENFGIAVVEALACGKPVLISNQINIWKEIEEGKAGIVSDDNCQSITQKLRFFFSMKNSERKQMSHQARVIYKEFFDVKVTVKQLINAIC